MPPAPILPGLRQLSADFSLRGAGTAYGCAAPEHPALCADRGCIHPVQLLSVPAYGTGISRENALQIGQRIQEEFQALTPEGPAICLEHNIPPPPGWRGGRRVLNALYLCISGRSPGLY